MTPESKSVGPLLVPLIVALIGLAGCHEAVDYEGAITVDPVVAPSTDGRVYLLVRDDESHAGDNGAGPDGYHIVQPDNGPIAYTSTTGQVEYFYSHYWPPNEVYLGAFIDLDGNGLLDPGEPWGEHPANPVLNPVAHHKGVNTVNIPIDRIYAQ